MSFSYTPHTGQVNPSHEGPTTSNLLLIAESPWKTEQALGRPLVGASGNKWNEWLFDVGMSRPSIRIENLYPFVPPAKEIYSVSDEKLCPWIEDLHRRIAQMPNLNCIATMGSSRTSAATAQATIRQRFPRVRLPFSIFLAIVLPPSCGTSLHGRATAETLH